MNAPHPAEQTLEGISGVSIENIFMGLNLRCDLQLKIAHMQSQGRGWWGEGCQGKKQRGKTSCVDMTFSERRSRTRQTFHHLSSSALPCCSISSHPSGFYLLIYILYSAGRRILLQ
jgi:hypothetical protein